jgi:hypothetical protein
MDTILVVLFNKILGWNPFLLILETNFVKWAMLEPYQAPIVLGRTSQFMPSQESKFSFDMIKFTCCFGVQLVPSNLKKPTCLRVGKVCCHESHVPDYFQCLCNFSHMKYESNPGRVECVLFAGKLLPHGKFILFYFILCFQN